jgi:glycosyltransferase involved in cell wall biosynthesis
MFPSFHRPLRILTWHIHGSYLFNLVQAPHDFYVPVKPGKPDRYIGLTDAYEWPDNLHEIPADEVHNAQFDCIIFQTRQNYFEDQYEILSAEQLQSPRIYLEHDPPWEHPTNTRHHVDDPNILLVHVTHFNNLMWDSGRTPTKVIEHGVLIPEHIRYTGELGRGLVVINNLYSRARLLGRDIFEEVSKEIPLDLVGINAHELGGVDSLSHRDLLEFESHYRFIFNPIRYTSLGLAVCEAMMIGMPIVGLATTEMATTIRNGFSGYIDTNVQTLVAHMRRLLDDPAEARWLGRGARRQAWQRFNIDRFVSDWNEAFALVTDKRTENASPRFQETSV